MPRKYTKEELIEMLKSRAEELGRSPRQREVKQYSTIVNHFGTFNNGLEAARLIPNKDYTKEELIEILQQRSKELGRSPKKEEVKQDQTIRRNFGSFNKGLEAAGLTPGKRREYTEEELIDILQNKAKELGRPPKKREVRQWSAIVKHFGSFNKGLEAAGLTPRKRREYTEEELIHILQEKAKELGRSPKQMEVKQWSTIVKRFGNFNKGLIAAGLAPNHKGRKPKN
ncbi:MULTISPECIES: homing endonuclease associated repeat-containing protein [Bacillus]|uniref:Uncharacterized protein n=1 Tax=Bacillus glycinifermentans TaxID=1664069 RepID=A0A0T6BI68_9BACI|nr:MULTISPECIES: hypothetical protein [Bacillus]KRT87143.1 hypothetical protein AB447_209260 [Bacillus glycinifermentans]MEC0341965.1 hypothetical protein [Bacillus sonorensis]MEC0457521.1 hypothetical protein [Bacillus sonorensis]MEC0487197.1 hypothetical protein [Bacillus glycinifermentans]MEC0530684.1 hypothetical protein [Bacillus sonorensis]